MTKGKGERKPLVLLIEDDEGLRYVMRRALEHAGFQVSAVSGHHGALPVMFGRNPIDAVVADQNLGDSLDGNTVARLVTRNNPHARVLIISGTENTTAFDRFLRKPIETDQLVAEVRACSEIAACSPRRPRAFAHQHRLVHPQAPRRSP